MGSDYSFLPYLFNEEIYIIRAPKKTETAVFKGVIFFVDYPGIITLPTNQKIFLDKVMEAVKLRLVQVTIVNIPELMKRLSIRALVRFESAKVIFFTGKLPAMARHLDINEKYELIEQENSEFILADVLEVIDQDRGLKKCLWASLKKLFSLP
ncbi:MAG TPA: hypothetical protein VI583_16525 [Cyclobacteriaceae bacterium]|nr:hypothetical protein [Cyclobacteriaceae bacterium]